MTITVYESDMTAKDFPPGQIDSDRQLAMEETTKEWFSNLPHCARDFLLEVRRRGPDLFAHTRRLSHAERHSLFTWAPGRVTLAPPSSVGGSSIGGCLEMISLLTVDTWAVMGLVCREWYLRRASYYQLFRQHARLWTIEDDEYGDSVEFVFCLASRSIQAPIPVELPELPMRIESDWADHRSDFLSVSWTFSDGTVYYKQLDSVTLTHWTNPLISEEPEDPLVEETDDPSQRFVVREPPYVSGFLFEMLELDILKPYPVTKEEAGNFRPYVPLTENIWKLLGSMV